MYSLTDPTAFIWSFLLFWCYILSTWHRHTPDFHISLKFIDVRKIKINVFGQIVSISEKNALVVWLLRRYSAVFFPNWKSYLKFNIKLEKNPMILSNFFYKVLSKLFTIDINHIFHVEKVGIAFSLNNSKPYMNKSLK